MLISHSKQFIFIHNYKVAGTSIRAALGKYRLSPLHRFQMKIGLRAKNHHKISDNHLTALQIKEKLSNKAFDQYFKFGFVRNPWDWQASLYRYALKNKKHKQHEIISRMKDFESYLKWRVKHDFRLQKAFFYDENDNCLVNFIGKYENLAPDFQYVCQQIKVKEHLEHRNQSQKRQAYLKAYTSETIALVQEYYAEDIATFGYEVPKL
ncbi:MAG: sulfotransferase family 2 domain-containing protein [Bacteroidota bacterium]